ncbi:MAG: sugar kinase [Candidatus Koribacter versatilis]|uniref:Sugar kinase n=1 Tax=Candidatus Korobacter versatilis TaxID=658062 RepID=A0A932A938_9BACT|nr:sugar kinase [Candidatus Koribacter versatilis]
MPEPESPLLVVGSVAFDTIKTPHGKQERILGGSATYFSLAASYFTDVRVIAVVGEDFTGAHEAVMTDRGVDTRGIQRAKGKTFHWAGEYGDNLNEAKTHLTELNVFEDFKPQVPAEFADSGFLFLANIDPVLQAQVRSSMPGVQLTGGDTMNFWIGGKRRELQETLKLVDILLVNDGEAKMLAEDNSLPRAAHKIRAMGPKAVVIKHGEYGATIFFADNKHPFRAPALPLDEVRDPTGAGDSFAGGFMGYIASQGKLDREVLKRAMFYGGVMGSFAVERFGTERLQSLTREEIEARFELFRELTHLE